jgi:hypothetical protein
MNIPEPIILPMMIEAADQNPIFLVREELTGIINRGRYERVADNT